MALDGGADGRRPFLIGSDWWRIQNFFAIFTYLCLFMAFIKTKISLDVVEVIATEWKLLLSYYHPIFPSFDAIQFLFILPHLCLLISNPLTLFSLLDPLTSLPLILTKMLSLGSVAMISINKADCHKSRAHTKIWHTFRLCNGRHICIPAYLHICTFAY